MTVEYVRPKLYPRQLEAIFDQRRYSLIEGTTKSGKTAGCMAWLTEQAVLGREGQNFWWTSPIFGTSKIAYRRIKRGLPRNLYQANETDLTITLANGAVMWFKGADKPDSLYGEDVHAAVIDEASRCKEESWHAIRTTLTATRGPARIIGNVKGRLNWFYALARTAEAGDPNMGYHKITWHDAVAAGILDESEIDDARSKLPAHVFRELYEAEPSDDGGNPFGVDAIRDCIGPMSGEEPAAYGLDLAKKLDWCVLVGLDGAGSTCRFDRWQGPWQESIARIRRQVGNKPCLVDSTGVGDPILEALQRDDGRNFEGFKFSQTSKQQLMEGLAVAIQSGGVTYPDGPIPAELLVFEYEYTKTGVRYSGPAGSHDDCVMGLALAVRHLEGRRKRTISGSWAA